MKLIAGQDGRSRYIMLETIREYGEQLLAASGEMPDVRRRHAAYFEAFVAAGAAELSGAEGELWRARFDAEHANLLAALRWMTEHDPLVALQVGIDLRPYWFLRGHLREGCDALEHALGAALADDVSIGLQAHALTVLGWLQVNLGALDEAEARFAEGLPLWREVGDRSGVMRALHGLAAVAEYHGDDDEAELRYE